MITSKSFFAIKIWHEKNRLLHDVVYASNTPESGAMMHMPADRECDKEISGYIGRILKNLGLDSTCDTSFLESL